MREMREDSVAMSMMLRGEARQVLELLPSPQLIAFAELLELPALELDQRIERELAHNPALERVEASACRVCGQTTQCGDCGGPRCSPGGVRVSDAAWLEALADPASLNESLIDAVRLELSGEDQSIAEHVLASLDERGFLDRSIAEVAQALEVGEERVRGVLDVLRRLGPPGIGAQNVRECLLLQMDALERGGTTCPLARRLVTEHLADLARLGIARLAASLREPLDAVQAAVEFIRCHLRPSAPNFHDPAGSPRTQPDVLIYHPHQGSDAIAVEVMERRQLRVESFYRRLADPSPTTAPVEARGHAVEAVRRAETFIAQIEGRASTIRRIVQYAAARQSAFLRDGRHALRPLSRAEVARELGLHESTVSRAVADKTAILPNGRLVPLSAFFEIRYGIEVDLRRLIAGEVRPLSDGELADRLSALGYRVARRTVSKYRDRLGVPVAAARS
jgi:RNA polymerase sigma-54 factor